MIDYLKQQVNQLEYEVQNLEFLLEHWKSMFKEQREICDEYKNLLILERIKKSGCEIKKP